MTTLEPRAGDVVLLSHGKGLDDPVARVIQLATGSPYTHAMLSMGDGLLAEANPSPHGDIADRVTEKSVAAGLKDDEHLLALRPHGDPVDQAALRACVADYAARKDQFSVGAMAGVGLAVLVNAAAGLQLLRSLSPDKVGSAADLIHRLRAAIFATLDDGDGRLFCSEFVYRVLTDLGHRPRMPIEPAVDLSGFPNDLPPPLALVGWFDQARNWFVGRWPDVVAPILAKVHLDGNDLRSAADVWLDITKAYEEGREPQMIHVANFFTPADFVSSPSYRRLSRRTRTSGWLPC